MHGPKVSQKSSSESINRLQSFTLGYGQFRKHLLILVDIQMLEHIL